MVSDEKRKALDGANMTAQVPCISQRECEGRLEAEASPLAYCRDAFVWSL